MSERSSSGEPSAPAVDTSQLEAINQMLIGDRVGVGFSLGDDGKVKLDESGAVDFSIGTLGDQGQVVSPQKNAANMVIADTTKDVRAEVRDQAIEVSANNEKHSMWRGIASKLGLGVPIGAAIATAEGAPGLAGAFGYLSRVANRVINDVATRSAEKKMIKGHKTNTTEEYEKAVNRIAQDIEVDGDKVAILNNGETRREAKNESEAGFESEIKSMLGSFIEHTSTILNPSDANPAEQYAQLEAAITAKVDAYNKGVHRHDASRGQFSANNFMQFAKAAKNALEQGAQVANVRAGIDKINMVFAEAASPVPEQKMSGIDKAAEKLHNFTGGILSVDTAGVFTTALAGIVAGSGQFGAMAASRGIPVPGLRAAVSAATAGAFAGVSEARRTTKERHLAGRRVAYGEGDKVSKEMQGALMEAESVKDITSKLNKQGNFLRGILSDIHSGKGEAHQLTAEERTGILSSLADIDQRIREQTSTGTPLFKFSSRREAEGEFQSMRYRRNFLQSLLASYDAAQTAKPGTEEFQRLRAEKAKLVNEELAQYLDQGNEKEALEQERSKADSVFKQLRRKRAVKAGVRTGAIVAMFSSANPLMQKLADTPLGQWAANTPLMQRFFGEGATQAVAKIGTTALMGGLMVPNATKAQVRQGNQTEKRKMQKYEQEELAQESQEIADELAQLKLLVQRGTEQLNGARPQNEAAPANAAAANAERPPRSFAELAEDQAAFMKDFRESMLNREIADREKAQEIFAKATGVTLPEPALEQLFWDSFYQYGHTPQEDGSMPKSITPDRIVFNPQAVADIMIARLNANPEMVEVWGGTTAEAKPTAAEAEPESPELRARRERVVALFKERFGNERPGQAMPSDEAINEMFNRKIVAPIISAPLAAAA